MGFTGRLQRKKSSLWPVLTIWYYDGIESFKERERPKPSVPMPTVPGDKNGSGFVGDSPEEGGSMPQM